MNQFGNYITLARGPRLAVRLAWGVGLACLVSVGAGLFFYAHNRAMPGVAEKFFPSEPVGGVAFAVLGVLVVARLPKNRVGWLFLLIGLAAALALFTDQYTLYALVTHPALLPWVRFVAWLHNWIWLIGNWAIGVLPLIFPTGRLLSLRWRWTIWLLTGSCGAFAGLIIGATWGMTAQQMWQFDDNQLAPALQILGTGLTLAMLGGYLLAAISLVVRLRQARGVERQQMKWFTFAVVLLVLSVIVPDLLQTLWPTQTLDTLSKFAQAASLAGMAVAIGLAILQYQLFAIDIIIRRTLVYTMLTGVLALIYFGSVVVLENFLHLLVAQNPGQFVTVLSTLAIAALFTPLRRRLQAGIDQRFYRRKYDAEQVLAAFGETVRNETDLEKLSERLVAVVQETMQPTQVRLWLRPREDADYGRRFFA